MNCMSLRWSLNPHICSNLVTIRYFSSGLKRLRTKTSLPCIVWDRSDCIIWVENILIKMTDIVVPGSITQIHIVSTHKILKRLITLRIHYWIQLINGNTSTVIDSTWLSASSLNQNRLICVANIPRSSNLVCFIYWQAKPVSYT